MVLLMAPRLSLVIPTYRRPDRLVRLIDALAHQTLPADRWEVLVVDDCSGPELGDTLASLPSRLPVPLQVLSTARNSGPAVARNLGWGKATAELLAFCDDDVVPDPRWLEAGLAALEADPLLGVVQGRTRVPDGVDVTALPEWSLWRQIEGAGPFFEGCNIFYRRAALEDAGGFDETINWWGEDTSTGWKVVEQGWRRGYAPDAGVVHDVELRGPAWFLRNGWLEKNVVALAARHPGYRQEAFWRPWAFRKRDAAFVVAAASVVAGTRWRPALVGTLPYLWWARPSIRKPGFLRACVEIAAVDAARSAGHLTSALRNRVLVI